MTGYRGKKGYGRLFPKNIQKNQTGRKGKSYWGMRYESAGPKARR